MKDMSWITLKSRANINQVLNGSDALGSALISHATFKKGFVQILLGHPEIGKYVFDGSNK